MVEITDGRIRHGGGYRRWAAAPGGTVEDDPLLAVLREGARQMLSLAIEAEVAAFVAVHADRVDETGRRRVVRHGHAPKRSIQTGIGPIEVQRPRVRDRGADDESERIRFTSAVLPAYLRRTRNVEELLPWLYLKGISTGQFEDTLKVLLGPDAPGLSAATIRRLVATWQDEHQRWQARDLSAKRYLYVWADGVYFAPRLEHDRQCILVLIGADAGGKKELLAIDDGFRESEQSWHELLVRLRDENGLVIDPELAIGDGALGFWKAARKIWPNIKQQRCWVHKTGLWSILGDEGQAAAWSSVAVTGSPSRKRTPRMISARRSEPFSRRQWRSADLVSLKTIASAVSRDRQPLVLSVRRRTVANVLSIGLAVRTCFQCSAGKS